MKNKKILNPVITGYNSASVVTKVDNNNYYIANATAQFFPGVMIYHSSDLVNWKLIDRPLKTREFLDIAGVAPDSGVMAPELIFNKEDKLFYLVYTVMYGPTPKCWYTTTKEIGGEWSKPKFLNGSGIDQSLFFEDGKMYVLTNEVNDQKGYGGVHNGSPTRMFQGINIQEYCRETEKLIGEPVNIWKGSDLDITEGPHLYKRGEYYYLMTAEGGMAPMHATSLCRSKNMYGPYELAPNNPIMTSYGLPEGKTDFTQAGHGSIVEDGEGNVWMISLANRQLKLKGGKYDGEKEFPLGCETILERYKWTEDGWLENYYEGEMFPHNEIEMPNEIEQKKGFNEMHDFTKMSSLDDLPIELFTVREPMDGSWLSFDNGLIMLARNGSSSRWSQSTIHRLWQSWEFEFETEFKFNPKHYKQKAGIMQRYSEKDQITFSVIRKYTGEKALEIRCDLNANGGISHPFELEIPEETEWIGMRTIVEDTQFWFEYKLDGSDWIAVPEKFSIALVSPIHATGWAYGSAVMGIYATDEFTQREEAKFKYFKYKEKET